MRPMYAARGEEQLDFIRKSLESLETGVLSLIFEVLTNTPNNDDTIRHDVLQLVSYRLQPALSLFAPFATES